MAQREDSKIKTLDALAKGPLFKAVTPKDNKKYFSATSYKKYTRSKVGTSKHSKKVIFLEHKGINQSTL